ncbi:MAG TPA: glycosyltransferase family 39 protein [Acidobacteriaceae bacterium]
MSAAALPGASIAGHADGRTDRLRLPPAATVFLVLTSLVILLTSLYEPMRLDEFLELQTDNVPSVRQLLHVQLTSPISLDPAVYHLVAHGALRLLGPSALALRLPSLLGYLLMQGCLFVFVRRIAGERAATFAMAVPALTLALYFASVGRPYGLQLGFFALAMVCWQSAVRDQGNRVLAVTLLAASIALALNTHYFGVLLPVCLGAAELFRSYGHRRLDAGVLAALGAGAAGLVFTVPFLKPAAAFRQNYYNTAAFSMGFIPRAYHDFFLHTGGTPAPLVGVTLLLLGIALVWMCARLVRRGAVGLLPEEAVFLLMLAALPVQGYLLARYATHSAEVRFVLGGVVGLSALLGIVLGPLLRRQQAMLLFVVLLLVIGARGGHLVLKDRRALEKLQAGMALPKEEGSSLLADPGRAFYFQDVRAFDFANYYVRDADVRSRLVLVSSRDQEMQWQHHDTLALTAVHMAAFTGLRIVPYESLTGGPSDQIFVLSHGDLEWLSQAFAGEHAAVQDLGPGLGGELVAVRFPQGRRGYAHKRIVTDGPVVP